MLVRLQEYVEGRLVIIRPSQIGITSHEVELFGTDHQSSGIH